MRERSLCPWENRILLVAAGSYPCRWEGHLQSGCLLPEQQSSLACQIAAVVELTRPLKGE